MYLLSNDEWCQFWWYFSFLCRWCWLGLAGGQVDIVIHNEYGVSISSPYQGPRHFPPSGLPWPASLEKTAVCRVRGGVPGPSWSSLCAMFLMSIKKGKIESSRTDVPDFFSNFGSRSRYLDRSQGWPSSGSSRQVAVSCDGDAGRQARECAADNEAATRAARVPRLVDRDI